MLLKKNIKKAPRKKIKLSAPLSNDGFEFYLMDAILWQIFKIILNIELSKKKHLLLNLEYKYMNSRIDNRITFKIKTRYISEILTLEKMKLHESTKKY